MRLLFVCDTFFVRSINGEIYSNTFSYEMFARYLKVFEKITVIGRVRECHPKENLPLASGVGVEFIFLESVSRLASFGGLRRKHRIFFENIIGEYERVIVRLPTEFGLIMAEVAREKKVKYLAEVVGCGGEALWYYGTLQAKLYAPYFFFKMGKAIIHAPYVHYVTQIFLQQRYPSSPYAETLGLCDIQLNSTPLEVLDRRLEKHLNHKNSKIIFGTMAFLNVRYKGIETALLALSRLNMDFEYHILGAGDKSHYQRLSSTLGIEKSVFFEGVLEHREVYSWLDKIDIYLQPSFTEGLSRSVIEAMSRGCPVIASDVGGMRELLPIEMLFEAGEAKALRGLIVTLIEERGVMSLSAQENFTKAQQYEIKYLEKKLEAFWRLFGKA